MVDAPSSSSMASRPLGQVYELPWCYEPVVLEPPRRVPSERRRKRGYLDDLRLFLPGPVLRNGTMLISKGPEKSPRSFTPSMKLRKGRVTKKHVDAKVLGTAIPRIDESSMTIVDVKLPSQRRLSFQK